MARKAGANGLLDLFSDDETVFVYIEPQGEALPHSVEEVAKRARELCDIQRSTVSQVLSMFEMHDKARTVYSSKCIPLQASGPSLFLHQDDQQIELILSV